MSDEPSPTETGPGSGQSGDPAASAGQSELAGLTAALGIEPARPGHDPLLGCDIGGVTIVRLIAEGGMGRVYEGKQNKPNRIVAVKVMRPGLTSPSVLKRFEYEAEVLGRLQHPGIAHIYSVGVHRVGAAMVPYFVMEYIPDAKSLTAYAEELKLPTRQRLDLFRSVCDAVAHGHQKGVIHRDLKPSNILVDASGQPKVIDFGVARATDSDMALTTMQTDVGQLLGTLQYMSPEQLDADPNDIDIRTDVYALGVVFYELLTGQPPYDVRKKAIHEVLRIVREEEPTPLAAVDRSLRGDVEVIAGKCLHKERARRYSSASELGEDVGRYLSGEPIIASPPGFLDSVMRWARRHRAAAATLAVILFALFVTVTGIAIFAVKAEQARFQAVQQETRATAAVYKQTLLRLSTAIQRRHFASGRALYPEVHAAWRAANPEPASPPLILRILDQQLGVQPLATLLSPTSSFTAIAFGGETNVLVTGDREGSVDLWDVDTATPRLKQTLARHAATWSQALPASSKAVRAVSITDDGKYVTAVSSLGCLSRWDTTDGRPRPEEHISAFTETAAAKSWFTHYSGALSRDGSTYAWRNADGEIEVRNTDTKQLLAMLTATRNDLPSAFLLAPDGKTIYIDTDTGTVCKRDTHTGDILATFRDCNVAGMAITADGARIAHVRAYVGRLDALSDSLIENDARDRIAVWDAASGNKLHAAPLRSHFAADTRCAAISPDASRIAIQEQDAARILLYDVSSGEIKALFTGHNTAAERMCFSQDGTRLVSLHADGSIRLWDSAHDESVLTLNGLTRPVLSLTFSPDGTKLATSCTDGTVAVWDADTYDRLASFSCGQTLAWAQFCDQGKRLVAYGPHTTRAWDMLTGAPVQLPALPGVGVDVSASGEALRWVGPTNGTLQCWDLFTSKPHFSLVGIKGQIVSAETNAAKTRCVLVAADGTVQLWSVTSRTLVATCETKPVAQSSVAAAISPRGDLVATASQEGTYLWDAFTGDKRVVVSDRPATSVLFSRSGDYVVAGSPGGSNVFLWDIDRGHGGLAQAKVIKPGERRDVAFLLNAIPKADEISSPKTIAQLAERSAIGKRLVSAGPRAFSPDGRLVSINDAAGRALLCDTVGCEVMAELEPPGGLGVLSFAPDSSVLAVASASRPDVRMYGRRADEVYHRRVRAEEARGRVSLLVDELLRDDPATVREKLAVSRSKLSNDEFRRVSNLVFKRMAESHSDLVSTNPSVSRPMGSAPSAGSHDTEVTCPSAVSACRENNEVWQQLFPKHFQARYSVLTHVLYAGHARSACVTTGTALGLFYCPHERKLFVDVPSYENMRRRGTAGGDFVCDYVVAHHFGHHVQNQLGLTNKVLSLRQRLSERDYRTLEKRCEVQADFLAGVWAHHVDRYAGRLEEHDIREAISASATIGEELRKQTHDTVVPDALMHATVEERVRWFLYGLKTGDPTLMDRAMERSAP